MVAPHTLAIRQFAELTGMHAVRFIANASSFGVRLLWILLLLAAVVILIYQLYGVALKFMSRPVSTNTDVSHHSLLPFPAVTFCNLNPLKFKVVQAMRDSRPTRTRRSTSSENALNQLTSLWDEMSMDEMSGSPENYWDRRKEKATSKRTYHKREESMFLLSAVGPMEKDLLTYRVEDMLVDCTFGETACTPNDFVSSDSAHYGKCFTFNAGVNSKRRPKPLNMVNSSSADTSLDMVLFIDAEDYMPESAPTVGIILVIHDSRSPPLPTTQGQLLQPGKHISMALRLNVFERAKVPYGRCKDFSVEENKKMNMYMTQLPLTLPTEAVCMKTCEQREVIRRCKCYSLAHGVPDAPAFSDLMGPNKIRACYYGYGSKDHLCMSQVKNEVMSGSVPCRSNMCKYQECRDVVYETIRSEAIWPARNSLNMFRRSVLDHPNDAIRTRWENLTETGNLQQDYDYIHSNFLRVRIYMRDLTVITMRTQSSYGVLELLSDVGAQGGLWLGISVFTAFEVLVLFWQLIGAFCHNS